MIGKMLGNFEILEKIGQGGMGEVYRARDTKLPREVAIKVMPAELAADPERLLRFEREAAAIASLKHPNIVTIHALEEDGGVHFIAMELVEGKTLADVIPEGGMALEDFLELALPIADALSSAHDKGIVHRDIKPGNIMMDADGRVKVLDFGLAKLAEAVPEDDQTITSDPQTAMGQVLGTIAYMAPEQAEGKQVDPRSDIFALGIVLFEMATGTHPYKRENSVSTLSAILQETPPPVDTSNPSLPAELGRITGRCLARKPEDRYASARELKEDLEKLGQPAAGAPRGASGILKQPVVWVSVLVLAAALVAGGVWTNQKSAKAKWAREEALPQIEQLVNSSARFGDTGLWEAYKLGLEVEKIVPEDPVFLALRDKYSRPMTIVTDPPGATVKALHYLADDEPWMELGTTPLDTVNFVAGILRVRIEKSGYETMEDVYWNPYFQNSEQGYVLMQTGTVPEGMVWAPESGASPRIEAAPAGISMPGIEHLPARDVPDFFIDRYEVTNREFKRFVDALGYEKPEYWTEPFVEDEKEIPWADAVARFTDQTDRPGPATWSVGDYPDSEDDYPVTGISFYEAAAYARYADKELPTIYHWDRVALPWASGDIVPRSNLNGTGLLPTGRSGASNRFGAKDMAGNVREWVVNQTAGGERFILGGGWSDPFYSFNDAYAQSPWDRSEINGIRCVRRADPMAMGDSLDVTIEMPFRDFLNEPRISEETFALYKGMYRYDRAPLNPVLEGTLETEDYVRERVVFDAAYGGERMAAYIFLPKHGTPPYQTVVYFPGSGSIHTRTSDNLSLNRTAFVPKSGRALVWPIYKSTYERGDGLASDYPEVTAWWRDHVIMWGKDIQRAVDLVESRDDLDGENIAFFGASWGAAMGPVMMAVEDRFKTGIVLVAGLLFQASLPEADPVHYLPRVEIPILMLNGKYDFFFPYDTSQVPFFEMLGTPAEDKKLVVHEASHSFPATEMARESLLWLDRYLGPTR